MVGKVLLNTIAIIISIVFVIGSWVSTGTPNLDFLRFFSIAVLACSVLLLVWDQWGWKLPLVQRIPSVARDISGTWETTLSSLWIDPKTDEGLAPKTVYLVVRQTSSSATITLLSDESKSRSSLARLVREDDGWVVHYIYTNEPNVGVREASPIHHGSGVLSVVGSPVKRLNGAYWTDRNSKGSLALKKRSPKFADDFDEAVELFNNAQPA